tara:strand:+ start:4387 stop:5154 length:768 start_codon:yes stop_codon:yes gene_type:complete
MIISFKTAGENFQVDLSKPIDLSLTSKTLKSFKAWYRDEIHFKTISDGDFIGSVVKGGSVNFKEIIINPHANMTHTESVGHISKQEVPINQIFQPFHYIAQLISVKPQEVTTEKSVHQLGDLCVFLNQIKNKINSNAEALILRTQENYNELSIKDYNNTNWPYLSEETAHYIRNCGIKHLLIDQPSVDKERDGGKLLSHKAFWDYPQSIDKERTITEFIGVPDDIEDGMFLLNLSIANIENDASPSRPVIYKPIF